MCSKKKIALPKNLEGKFLMKLALVENCHSRNESTVSCHLDLQFSLQKFQNFRFSRGPAEPCKARLIFRAGFATDQKRHVRNSKFAKFWTF